MNTGDGANGGYRQTRLVSSKGDTLYVKAYYWGLTNDKQLSTVADTDEPIGWGNQRRADIVVGLDPFLYRFAQDTLTLYARAPLPHFPIRAPSVVVQYREVTNPEYMTLFHQLSKTP
ncbi:hypothetical protein [Hymenobacter rubidus]|uniref:hypothetical protein n=1 Tax=Hymenobacter rubidus TaxID=1441626 RepID=UPI00191EB3BC|nr:hypothetical protein [Hymenobacter rubidus]